MAHEITATDSVLLTGQPAWHGLGILTEDAPNPHAALQMAGLDWNVSMASVSATVEVDEWIADALRKKVAATKARIEILDDLLRTADDEARAGLSEEMNTRVGEAADAMKALEAGVLRVPVPGFAASIRSDTISALGVMSDGFCPVQNRDLGELAYELGGEEGAEVETTGSLGGGRRVWMLLRNPETAEIVPGDRVQPYVALTNGHDGSSAFGFFPTSVRVVCANTYRMAERAAGANVVRFLHTANVHQRIEASKKALRNAFKAADVWADTARLLAADEATEEAIRAFFFDVTEKVYGAVPTAKEALEDAKAAKTRERRLALVHEWDTMRKGEKQAKFGVQNTMWGAFNAVTEWADHRKNFLTRNGDSETMARANSRLFAGSHEVKRAAWAIARTSAKATATV
jgi:phage/plasmid-like protein (TIGR03299 family)